MNIAEEINTILQPAESKLKEKGSIFIGKISHINNEDEAVEILSGIRKKFFDASHHCYAYRLSSGAFKYSDDGEPSGTAGTRILNAIDHFKLTNCLIVVIRYFGGTKLGVGPLGKAYYSAAFSTIEQAEIVTQKAYYEVTIDFEFPLLSSVHRILSADHTKIKDTNYEESVKINCMVEVKKVDLLKAELHEISKGKIKILVNDDFCYL